MFKFLKRKPGKQESFEVTLPSKFQEGKLNSASSTWMFISTWANDELSAARERNDYMKNDQFQTAALRGRIKLLKELLKLPEVE